MQAPTTNFGNALHKALGFGKWQFAGDVQLAGCRYVAFTNQVAGVEIELRLIEEPADDLRPYRTYCQISFVDLSGYRVVKETINREEAELILEHDGTNVDQSLASILKSVYVA